MESFHAHYLSFALERYRQSVPYVAQSVSISALHEPVFLRTPQESKRQAAAIIIGQAK
jgi:hypothetical protein